MLKELQEVREMAGDLRHGIFQNEETVNALIDGIIFRVDNILNQDEAEMVWKVAQSLNPNAGQPDSPHEWDLLQAQAKAALRTIGLMK